MPWIHMIYEIIFEVERLFLADHHCSLQNNERILQAILAFTSVEMLSFYLI